MTRKEFRWIRRSETRSLPALPALRCQRRVRDTETALICSDSVWQIWPSMQQSGRKIAHLVVCFYCSWQNTPLSPISSISSITVLIIVSYCMRAEKSWSAHLKWFFFKNTAALSVASVALYKFNRTQAIWSLFIALQMTHNGNLACDERTGITDKQHETGINLHLIFFKGDV